MSTATSSTTTSIFPEVSIKTFIANPQEGDIDLVINDFVSLDRKAVPGWRVLPHIRKGNQWVCDSNALFYTSLDQIIADLKAGKFSK